MRSLDRLIDVTDALRGLPHLTGEQYLAVTVTLPRAQDLPERPFVCFAKPGGGYSKGYYTVDLPGPAAGAQADWHADRGWVFVSIDHLGVGGSSVPEDPRSCTYAALSAAAHAAEAEVLARLSAGTLLDGFPPVVDPVVLGIGQSMGGCLTVIQQGRFECYDGIGVLGYSAVHTNPATMPGTAPIVPPWIPRDVLPESLAPTSVVGNPDIVNKTGLLAAALTTANQEGRNAMGWGFHWDDVDPSVVEQDVRDFPTRGGQVPEWGSATLPVPVAVWCLGPGAIAPEAAAVRVPVLAAFGERDVSADPAGEPRAYRSAASVDLFVCPAMAHMHNFAGTRELFWQRIETWASWVRAVKASAA